MSSVGEQVLTLEELSTLSVKIVAILNSWPLVALFFYPNELDFLILGHFLMGTPFIAQPKEGLVCQLNPVPES